MPPKHSRPPAPQARASKKRGATKANGSRLKVRAKRGVATQQPGPPNLPPASELTFVSSCRGVSVPVPSHISTSQHNFFAPWVAAAEILPTNHPPAGHFPPPMPWSAIVSLPTARSGRTAPVCISLSSRGFIAPPRPTMLIFPVIRRTERARSRSRELRAAREEAGRRPITAAIIFNLVGVAAATQRGGAHLAAAFKGQPRPAGRADLSLGAGGAADDWQAAQGWRPPAWAAESGCAPEAAGIVAAGVVSPAEVETPRPRRDLRHPKT